MNRHNKFPDIRGLDNELDLLIKQTIERTGKKVKDFPPLNQTPEFARFIKKISEGNYKEYIKIDGGFRLLCGCDTETAFIEFRVDSGFLQWRSTPDGEWINLLDLSVFIGTGEVTDPDAIHVNISNEINGVASKTAINGNDVFLIEDGEDSYAKKKKKVIDFVPGSPESWGVYGAKTDPFNDLDNFLIQDSDDFLTTKIVDWEKIREGIIDAITFNIDGGSSSSIYLFSQIIDGEGA
jgi:hypothetical protein